jgi:hypothetical protein
MHIDSSSSKTCSEYVPRGHDEQMRVVSSSSSCCMTEVPAGQFVTQDGSPIRSTLSLLYGMP